MFRWKKRDEGFEWREYVRTTIMLRRNARRQKAEVLGQQAAAGARKAGAVAGNLARGGAERAGTAAKKLLDWLGDISVAALGLTGLLIGHLAQALLKSLAAAADVLGRPGVAGPLMLAGLIAIAGGLARYGLAGKGLDTETTAAMIIGAVCLLLGLAPAIALGHKQLIPKRIQLPSAMPALGTRGSIAIGLAVVLAAGGAGAIATMGNVTSGFSIMKQLPSMPSIPFISKETVEGRASALSAGLIRIDKRTIRLDGIEPPHPSQRCERDNGKSWRCGAAAKDATAKLLRGQNIKCEVGAPDAHGMTAGTCRAGTSDIAEMIVRGGHAFSTSGFMAGYTDAEAAAQKARAGIWAAAKPERPDAWRARLWEEARKDAPDGCPIKGRISRGERVYLLPWSNRYERVRIRQRRGERWFCSEEDAAAAGWRSAEKG